MRRVDLAPELLDELKAHKLAARWAEPSDFVFPGRNRGRPRERNSVRTRVLYPAIERANATLTVAGRQPIPAGVTFHSLRRTYASLEFADGADPAYVQGQIGHRTARLTLEVYAQKGNRRRPTATWGSCSPPPNGHEWAQTLKTLVKRH